MVSQLHRSDCLLQDESKSVQYIICPEVQSGGGGGVTAAESPFAAVHCHSILVVWRNWHNVDPRLYLLAYLESS